MSAQFFVEDCVEIKGRGPTITRSREASKAAHAAGSMFICGDRVTCGLLEAEVVGIEHYACMGLTGELQLAMLLRGVDLDDIKVGQVWSKVE